MFQNRGINNIRLNRSRRGAGVMVSGAILAAILFTSVYMYFFVIMEAQTTRGIADSNIQQLEKTKKLENLQVSSFQNQSTNTINVKIQNTGTIPIKIAYVAMYDEDYIPVDDMGNKQDMGLNPGNEVVLETGVAADEDLKYKIDALTERGNVISTVWPPEGGDLTPDQINTVTNISNRQFTINTANGLGSLQLDFKSLGVIFWDRHGSPDQPVIRNQVDQRGWDVKFGNTTGYPAFLLPGNSKGSVYKPEVIVMRVRNIDTSGENMTLYANTGLSLTLAGQNPNQSPIVYLCYPDQAKNELSLYNENDPNKKYVLPNALKYDLLSTDEGWVYLYFCDGPDITSDKKPAAISKWEAKKFAIDLNPIFLVARGEFNDSYLQYGQTIPYQAVTITDDAFFACLKTKGTIDLQKACPNTTDDFYKGKPTSISKKQAFVYIAPPYATAPYSTTVLWLNPDGTVERLTSPTSTANPIPIDVPDVPAGLYIVQVIDKDKNIYSMTFKVE